MEFPQPKPYIPVYPTYDEIRQFIRLIDGTSYQLYKIMVDRIQDNRGTPQDTKDWKNPDAWIPEVLSGKELDLALHLWRESKGIVNPRHLVGVWLLSVNYGFLKKDQNLILTDLGREFIKYPFGEIEQRLDYAEGLIQLLAIVAERRGKRSDLLPKYAEFLATYSEYRTETTQRNSWFFRMANLVDRGLVEKIGVSYQISNGGLSYLKQSRVLVSSNTDTLLQELVELAKRQQDEVHAQVVEELNKINPYLLEHLVKRLLVAIGYVNVEVTSKSGDGGVDVVADIEVGITKVREVVQVKRHKSNIQRKVLDELRGSLHRFDANRGTIITTGNFSQGAKDASFERGAAPITLIDGKRLLELLLENGIGLKRDTVIVYEFIPSDFKADEAPMGE